MVELLTALHNGEVLSQEGCRQVLDVLGRQHFSMLGRELKYDLDAVEAGARASRVIFDQWLSLEEE